jgi:superfamily I DNA and/or RNA helicase
MPEQYGYFLPESRRMAPDVTTAVSRLAYDGQLHSHPSTAGRSLDGLTPGVHPVPLSHIRCSTESQQEADEAVRIIRTHLDRSWIEAAGTPARPLAQTDFIVVTPYNAQVQCITRTLERAGLEDVPVGTVDKFQGREAVIAIVSLATSDATELPRGLEFLLSRNRLNVSISRAQWAAFLIHSPRLLDVLPTTPAGVATLSRFITLVTRES